MPAPVAETDEIRAGNGFNRPKRTCWIGGDDSAGCYPGFALDIAIGTMPVFKLDQPLDLGVIINDKYGLSAPNKH